MTRTRRYLTAGAVVISMVGSGAAGAAIVTAINSPASAVLAATTTTPSPGTGAQAQPNGPFVPNEDPAHEAGESAAREAQEDAGQRPTVP